MIDESMLDAPDALARADLRGLLRALAGAGARVRVAARAAEESDLHRLSPQGRPGTVLVAGPAPAGPLLARTLNALVEPAVRVHRVEPVGPLADPGALRWPLPEWVGPMDLLLILGPDGSEPGLGELFERAWRRGCAAAVIAPVRSSLSELAARRNSPRLPLVHPDREETADHPAAPGPAWSAVTPALMLADRLGLCEAGPAIQAAVADRLDAVAGLCGPASAYDRNPAKVLAGELDGVLPLLWSRGPLGRAAADHAVDLMAALPGLPALAAPLPEALAAHGPVLAGGRRGPGADPEDLFRDRVDEPPSLLPRVVLLHDTPPNGDAGPNGPNGPNGSDAGPGAEGADADGTAVPSALPAARALAGEHGVPITEFVPEPGEPLPRLVDLVTRLDFTAVYLALTPSGRS
ncbi:SIS domain-containing protein [Streptomyces calidiresistens]|uniref:Mannose-6-phosphate isomerase n=1 Tax=Streptomyces calidiresistens TaxID=1485586 RepID=A0A7W3XXN8_9ACTN|nr:mannose-6-phosphate isomerase [Streptomyces calidiresistens]MBB0231129.1 mannose-6-phosphate isomerase [Streptomyces calidiresistens]